MKIAVGEAYSLAEGLEKLLDVELPTSVAFSIQRNYKKVSEEVKASEEFRKKLVEKYKDREDEDGTIHLRENKIQAYNTEALELLEQEVDVDLRKLNIEDLGESIAPRTLGLLDPILSEEE